MSTRMPVQGGASDPIVREVIREEHLKRITPQSARAIR